MLIISPSIIIDDSELQERFVRSSGPGGQNVNKVSTAVELRFDIKNSACLPEPLRERLLARSERRLTADGVAPDADTVIGALMADHGDAAPIVNAFAPAARATFH